MEAKMHTRRSDVHHGVATAFAAAAVEQVGHEIDFIAAEAAQALEGLLPLARPGGELGALRLTLVSIAIAMIALIASEVLARRISRRIEA